MIRNPELRLRMHRGFLPLHTQFFCRLLACFPAVYISLSSMNALRFPTAVSPLFLHGRHYGFQTRLLCIANKASLHSKQGFFDIKRRLLLNANKACFKTTKNEFGKQRLHSHENRQINRRRNPATPVSPTTPTTQPLPLTLITIKSLPKLQYSQI